MADEQPAALIAEQVRAALEAVDLAAMSDLLDPHVHWGAPDDPAPSCQNRHQVLAWYQEGRRRGVRAEVTEMVVGTDRILMGLRVTGPEMAGEFAGEFAGTGDRWQVLTVDGGRVVDIRAFDDRAVAAAAAGLPPDPGPGPGPGGPQAVSDTSRPSSAR